MSLLDQLFLEYGYLNHDQLTQNQIWTLRNNLKDIGASEVTSIEEAKHFLSLLRKFREYIADADKLHGDNYPDLLSSLLSVGEDGLYSNNLRFIFELIQNVDDCEYDNEEDHILDTFSIKQGLLYAWNAARSLKQSDDLMQAYRRTEKRILF